MANIIGEFNTEAKCIAYSATTTNVEPMSEINSRLSSIGAFDAVNQRTYNTAGILDAMPDFMVSSISDYENRRLYVSRNSGFFGKYLHGFAGSIIELSLNNNRSIRTLVGEKVNRPGYMNSTELRLGVLASMKFLSDSTSNGIVDNRDLFEYVEDYFSTYDEELKEGTFNNLTRRMANGGLIHIKRNPKSKKIIFAEKPDGTKVEDEVTDLLDVIGKFAAPSIKQVNHGIEFLDEASQDRTVISQLIKRSYVNSGHTGKKSK